MDFARYAIDKPVNTWLLIIILVLGGWWGINTVGRLEDPAFTLKQAVVVTPYPGASAIEVEQEVTEHLESAIQQLGQLKRITSKSVPGRSEITVEIQDTYTGQQIPQIWDELRRKVGDFQRNLPEGAGPTMVNDDFSDVFGIFYAVTADGFSIREIRDIARFLRRQLLTVDGVAKIEIRGLPEEAIYVDLPNEKLISSGLPLSQVISSIQSENAVQSAGAARIGDLNVRISNEPGLDSVANIEALRIGRAGSTEQISLVDMATVSREAVEIPDHEIRYDGERAFTLAVAGVADANIVEVGRAVSRALDDLREQIPLGVELHPIYEQHEVVDEAINDFIVNLATSVAIVIGVLCLFMGWRVGLVVGLTLLLTVLGTVFMMRIFNIEMERISLGALIIAMGMLVDNAIVIAEGMLINMQRGMKAHKAASDAAARTQWPLLGATLIGIMAFSGIGLSQDTTGEFLFSLFAVIGMSLLLSWVLAVTVTPLFGEYLLKVRGGTAGEDPYKGLFYQLYRQVLQGGLRARTLTVSGLILITVVSFWSFGFVKQAFFPDSNTPMFFVDYRLAQGSDIRAVARDIEQIDEYVMSLPGVESVASFIGQGASRFMLTYEPQQPDSAYAQMIIRTQDRSRIDALAERLRLELGASYPAADIQTRRIVFGPGGGAKIEARFAGEDPRELRRLADQVLEVFAANDKLIDLRHNWYQRELIIAPQFNEERARIAGVARSELAQTLEFATTGVQAGTYRESDEQIPIIIRPPDAERLNVERIQERLIWSAGEQRYVPITQVVDQFATQAEDTLIMRRDRARTITVQAEPRPGATADEVLREIRSAVEAIPLPPGYSMSWGGEFEASAEAQQSLGAQLPLSFVVMLIISVLIFGKVRQPLIIWLVVPMSLVGVVAGLLLSDLPFSFTALLGFLSLSGMLMKNAIVLVDEIDEQLREGKAGAPAIIDASVSRLRPVFLAAATTILGMIPLLGDAFFASMAVTIMGGLAFASVLTLVAVPVLYALLFRIKFSG
ncbi:efflux RND transporter permease subunit [Pseudohongiella spirulinae]|uniref:Multidrug transporter AcrB n=1 Tax=Pseudohongiella spirulinae TaxID=1249552 RepID=A0A0S2KCY7_9GAMM|nr:efflux RND transporter permease subunit [Pseudohongiella spirulinae]ALO46186.1 multidrug transporter AcrB [Pseudohongiella spirulinae]